MDNVKTFSPGSNDAIDAGCSCPVLSNRHGKGAFFDEENKPVFWFNNDCKLHGGANNIDPKARLYEEKR